MNVELFLYLCKQVGLTIQEMDEYMTIGMCLDYVDEYIENNKRENNDKPKVRKASQDDYDLF